MRIQLLSCLTLASVLLCSPLAGAYELMGPKWPDARMPIQWQLDADGVDNLSDGSENEEVKRAVQAWEDVACSKLTFGAPTTLASASRQATGDGANKVFWVEANEGWNYGRNTLGVTTPKYYGTGELFDADIEFNGDDYNWSAGQGSYCSNCTDTFSIALHEFGHFFGLDHSATQSAIMYEAYPGSPKQTLATDDVAGICALYPTPDPNTVPQGAGCTQMSDCVEGLVCATAQTGDERICTAECAGSSDTSCPDGFECRAASAGFACFTEQQQGGTGGEDDACGASVGACGAGLVCVGTGGSSGTCQRSCNPAASDCPAGKSCYATGGGQGACFPGNGGGGPAGEGELCGGIGCEGSLQCVGSSTADARCRQSCTPGVATSCPANFACASIGGGAGACIPSTVQPPALAGLCESCEEVACESGLQCSPDSDGERRCRRTCHEDTRCGAQYCIARSDLPGATGACSCPGVAIDARAEGESCASSAECADGALCIRDGAAGPVCRTTCNPDASSCVAPTECLAIGAAFVCSQPASPPPDEGDDDEGAFPFGCGGCSSSAGIGWLAALVVASWGRRRRLLRD